MKIFMISIGIALDGIFTNKLRSFLTMLGIIFGVMAVVAMLAIGAGAQEKILAQIAVMGIRNVYVYDTQDVRAELLKGEGKFSSFGLSSRDVVVMSQILGNAVDAVAPVKESLFAILYSDYRANNKIVATSADYFSALNLQLSEGRFFTSLDVSSRNAVCVIGGGLALRLKREGFKIGDEIKIRDQWFGVVGVLESKAISAKRDDNLNYEDFNDNIYLPINATLMIRNIGGLQAEYDRLIMSCRQQEQVGKVGVIVDRTLMRRHHELRDYKIVIPEDLLRQSQETRKIFDLVLGLIAAISLVVGGIGIMNIMLASVLERTKEIGLRRALGATGTHIQFQFLLEAVLLSVLGGVIGILLAFLMTWIISAFLGMPTKISIIACGAAFGVSTLVGIASGFYPAKRAGEMSPIEALRYE
jgi:putative ABC transport system permease protein